MQYYNFSTLIKKYSSEITIISTTGDKKVHGEWVKGTETRKTVQGAVISFKESKIYRPEGTLTAQDKRLFVLEALGNLVGSKVLYDKKYYTLQECSDNSKFTGCFSYTLKFVSALNKEG